MNTNLISKKCQKQYAKNQTDRLSQSKDYKKAHREEIQSKNKEILLL